MKCKTVLSTIIMASLMSFAGTAEAKDPETCKVTIAGALQRSFPCKAELRQLGKQWNLIIGGNSSLPVDFAAMLSFAAPPLAKKAYAITDIDGVTIMVRDKHDNDSNSWSASASKKPSPFGPRKVNPPAGSLKLMIASIGPEPTVHGLLEAKLKAPIFNKNKKEVTVTYQF